MPFLLRDSATSCQDQISSAKSRFRRITARRSTAGAFLNFHRQFAKGRVRRSPGTMNGTETAYAEVLRTRQICGEIAWYMFEGIKLRLADNTFLTPDFFVMLADGTFEAHEVKGTTKRENAAGEKVERPFYHDDAIAKIRFAASLYPIRFMMCFKKKLTGWELEEM